MTMLRLTPQQRADLSETMRDLANLAFGALVLGQFIGAQPVSWLAAMAGFLMWVALVGFALALPGGES